MTAIKEKKPKGKQAKRSDLTKEAEAVKNSTMPLAVANIGESVQIELADSLLRYKYWPSPTVIVSDGPYGLHLFPGDPWTFEGLVELYEPHIKAWAEYSLPETTLWFWCNEIGWATIHPILARHGWIYRNTHIWDKGIGHIAGNVNSKTIRMFPIVTEICVQYVRDVKLPTVDGQNLSLQHWLRYEWLRTGLPLYKTNEACGIKNAATRKYFTADNLWYFPPPEMMERIIKYANEFGRPEGKPYFSIDRRTPLSRVEWEHMRPKWNHLHGVTNVWHHPPIHGLEREKDDKAKTLHANQKPLTLLKRIIQSSSDENDVLWEPFGGLCTTALAALKTRRKCYSAEIVPSYFELAKKRLERAVSTPTAQPSLFDEDVNDDLDDARALIS